MSDLEGDSGFVDRLYALNGGLAVAPDGSVYSPGRWQGEQVVLSCNAYLILRGDEWIMWDTGIDDAVADESDGRAIAHNIRGIVPRTIRDQLGDVGITPEDVKTVILSYAHFDHVGNCGCSRTRHGTSNVGSTKQCSVSTTDNTATPRNFTTL